jgi:hypothetical protein
MVSEFYNQSQFDMRKGFEANVVPVYHLVGRPAQLGCVHLDLRQH